VLLSPEQERELRHCRDHHRLPYMRTKAAAILKVAAGHQIQAVASQGLNQTYQPETVSKWITRYQTHGLDGLRVQLGRGRKPAFSPCAPRPGNCRRSGPRHRLPLPAAL